MQAPWSNTLFRGTPISMSLNLFLTSLLLLVSLLALSLLPLVSLLLVSLLLRPAGCGNDTSLRSCTAACCHHSIFPVPSPDAGLQLGALHSCDSLGCHSSRICFINCPGMYFSVEEVSKKKIPNTYNIFFYNTSSTSVINDEGPV